MRPDENRIFQRPFNARDRFLLDDSQGTITALSRRPLSLRSWISLFNRHDVASSQYPLMRTVTGNQRLLRGGPQQSTPIMAGQSRLLNAQALLLLYETEAGDP